MVVSVSEKSNGDDLRIGMRSVLGGFYTVLYSKIALTADYLQWHYEEV